MKEMIPEEPQAAAEHDNREFATIGELIRPLKRPETETFEDYKARRMMANTMIKFYMKYHYWPKVES